MFGIGGFELFLILLFGFLIFGPDKLPQIAKTVGQGIAKFRKAQDEMNSVIKKEVYDPMASSVQKAAEEDTKTKSPLDALSQLDRDDEPQESFSERKARFDRERAEKEKKAEIERNRAAMKAEASGSTPSQDAAPEAAKPATAPKVSAAELYGTKPMSAPAESSDVQHAEGE